MKSIFLLTLLFSAYQALAEESLRPIEVLPPEEDSVKGSTIPLTKVSSDTAQLLNMIPSVSFQSGGGLSSLPVIQGMADDRVNVRIDGASSTSSCPNHMNPSLSYLDPAKVSSIDVLAGITPVSEGGDSIGGSIVVKTRELEFSASDELIQDLNFKSFYRSNNENSGASVLYSLASKKNYVAYEGFTEEANDYRNGRGKRLKSTLYNRNNQTLTLGHKLDDGVLSLKYKHTIVPYEGFINQRMDMADNVSNHLTANYRGMMGNALVDSSLYYQHTNHFMDMISSEREGSMPMYTRSDELGYNFKLYFEVDKNHTLNVGSDFNHYRLDDWWPSLPGVTAIMGPGTFNSINNGKRDRLGLFVEGDSQWTPDFSTNLGVRTDIVTMDTGSVHGYNDSDNLPADAAAFNGKSHKKTDHNYDITLTSKLVLTPKYDLEFGAGQKTRSPNLYERYAWAGSVTDPTDPMSMSSMGASMDMLMINWFGDGNGYVGNISLKPEVAHKLSTSFVAHDESRKDWEVRFTPYYSQVKNFIDADLIGSSMGSHYLRFANHDAVVFGADLSGKVKLSSGNRWGDLSVKSIASYTRGYRKDGEANLYHLMPLNGKIAFEHSYKKWTTDFVTHLVNRKKQVNKLRQEPTTPGYALFDLGTNYQITKMIGLDFRVSNLLDQHFSLPLGGVDLVNHSPSSRTAVAGMGRSYNLALTIDLL